MSTNINEVAIASQSTEQVVSSQIKDGAVPPEQSLDSATPPEPDYDALFQSWRELQIGQYGY